MNADYAFPSGELTEAPEFGLECLYDDAADPAELTVFSPEDQRLTTEWVTADVSTAVPLEEVR
jgi:hypothetical protein